MTTHTQDVSFRVSVSDMPALAVRIDAAMARRKVSGWAGNISTSCGAGTPTLFIEPLRVFWRVPVYLTHGRLGYVGDIGTVDMDAQTGDMAVSDTLIKQMTASALELIKQHPELGIAQHA